MEQYYPKECVPFIPRNWSIFTYDEVKQADFEFQGLGFVVAEELNAIEKIHLDDCIRANLQCAWGFPPRPIQNDTPTSKLLMIRQRDEMDQLGLNVPMQISNSHWHVPTSFVRYCAMPERMELVKMIVIKTLFSEMLALNFHILVPGIHYERHRYRMFDFIHNFIRFGLLDNYSDGEEPFTVRPDVFILNLKFPGHICPIRIECDIGRVRSIFNEELGLI